MRIPYLIQFHALHPCHDSQHLGRAWDALNVRLLIVRRKKKAPPPRLGKGPSHRRSHGCPAFCWPGIAAPSAPRPGRPCPRRHKLGNRPALRSGAALAWHLELYTKRKIAPPEASDGAGSSLRLVALVQGVRPFSPLDSAISWKAARYATRSSLCSFPGIAPMPLPSVQPTGAVMPQGNYSKSPAGRIRRGHP